MNTNFIDNTCVVLSVVSEIEQIRASRNNGVLKVKRDEANNSDNSQSYLLGVIPSSQGVICNEVL